MKKSSLDQVANIEIFPEISVALPVYNGEKYLAEAIESILAQTFKDFEFIIIDDGSKDNSLNILREYEKRDHRIHLIARENRNVAATLNEIVFLARGRWIARMDQDDVALPQRFEHQLAWIKKTGADISGAWVQRFGTSDKRIVRFRQTHHAIKMEMLFCSPFAHPTVMVLTEKIKTLLYDETRWEAEDYDLWERAAHIGWKMTNVPEVLLRYRVHPAQISSNKAIRQQQLTQEIRRRYWEFTSQSLQLKQYEVNELLKTFELSAFPIDMDAVDSLFMTLLCSNQGEARDIIFDHMIRTYFRVAATCPNVVSRWRKLNREFGKDWGVAITLKLSLFRLFRIQPNSALFEQLKKIYVWIESR